MIKILNCTVFHTVVIIVLIIDISGGTREDSCYVTVIEMLVTVLLESISLSKKCCHKIVEDINVFNW